MLDRYTGKANSVDTLGVFSCVWNRPERLRGLITALATQQYAPKFTLYLINNNPALRGLVTAETEDAPIDVVVINNDQNMGAYGRWLVMIESKYNHEWLMTLDDDIEFTNKFLHRWWNQRDDGKVLGWKGFNFKSDYWDRETVAAGNNATFLLGSNIFIPSWVVTEDLYGLRQKYWNVDDLWFSYNANHIIGVPLYVSNPIGSEVVIDEKDTYTSLYKEKIELLEELRLKGWKA